MGNAYTDIAPVWSPERVRGGPLVSVLAFYQDVLFPLPDIHSFILPLNSDKLVDKSSGQSLRDRPPSGS